MSEMVTVSKTRKVTVLGMGNLLLRDEGVGVHVAQAMADLSAPPGTEMTVIDGGTLPDVIPLAGVDKLIVIDAVKGGGEPGSIYRFRPGDITIEAGTATSLHQLNLLENLQMMSRLGEQAGEVVIIGIEPGDTDWGLTLSPPVQQRLPRIVELVMAEARSASPDNPEKGEQQ